MPAIIRPDTARDGGTGPAEEAGRSLHMDNSPWAPENFGDPSAPKLRDGGSPTPTPTRRTRRSIWGQLIESAHWAIGGVLVGALATWFFLWGRMYRTTTWAVERMERERSTLRQAQRTLEEDNAALRRQLETLTPPSSGTGPSGTKRKTLRELFDERLRELVARDVARTYATLHAWDYSFIESAVRTELLGHNADPTLYDVDKIVERAFALAGKKLP